MGEVLVIVFGVMLAFAVLSAPWLAAENRPEFLRPELKPEDRWDGPLKRSH